MRVDLLGSYESISDVPYTDEVRELRAILSDLINLLTSIRWSSVGWESLMDIKERLDGIDPQNRY